MTWKGTLGGGQGVLRDGGAMDETPVDWASTDASAEGTTSPEQLLAAAEAGCYAMTLALALTRRGHPAERLDVTAACELEHADQADDHEYRIARLALDVRGTVPGIDHATFTEIARHADEQCPISAAVRGNVEVELNTALEGPPTA